MEKHFQGLKIPKSGNKRVFLFSFLVWMLCPWFDIFLPSFFCVCVVPESTCIYGDSWGFEDRTKWVRWSWGSMAAWVPWLDSASRPWSMRTGLQKNRVHFIGAALLTKCKMCCLPTFPIAMQGSEHAPGAEPALTHALLWCLGSCSRKGRDWPCC